ncbi:hypothetical protein ADENT20671_2575 [Actinomyces denticolens]|nr:hypothetical protein ADENT20671_2575 [Actinomyces denticolens]
MRGDGRGGQDSADLLSGGALPHGAELGQADGVDGAEDGGAVGDEGEGGTVVERGADAGERGGGGERGDGTGEGAQIEAAAARWAPPRPRTRQLVEPMVQPTMAARMRLVELGRWWSMRRGWRR